MYANFFLLDCTYFPYYVFMIGSFLAKKQYFRASLKCLEKPRNDRFVEFWIFLHDENIFFITL